MPQLPTITRRFWRTAVIGTSRNLRHDAAFRFRGHPRLARILMWDGYPIYRCARFPAGWQTDEMPDVAFSKTAPL